MKVAVVYNRESKNVINLFGMPNREKYGKKNIKRIVEALKAGGHQVIALEGDKDLIDRLEEFMPRVLKGERPGMVFNLSYGIQGQARYTHVPGMLEMVGIPYVGSGPLAHSLALDKVVAKMIFRQQGIPTPEFAVLDGPDFPVPEMPFPLIVKPKNEAVSFGLKIVHDEAELRQAAQNIFDKFDQAVLAEQYVDGREINVGILGNSPAEALPPAELVFGDDGPPIYTYEDKTHRSGREIGIVCPAPVDEALTRRAQDIAVRSFHALGCYDCARIDMRLDREGNLYVLEINSLPSLGEHGSYPSAAKAVGLDFTGLVNRLVEVASARYFGTPTPPQISVKDADPRSLIFSYLTERRDRIEKRLQEWTAISSRTSDPVGLQAITHELGKRLAEIGLEPVAEFTDERCAWTWEAPRGFANGILMVVNLDVPLAAEVLTQTFRRDPEWLYGEGIATSRAPLTMMEFALRALRHQRRLKSCPVGVLFYTDEGRDARYSGATIRAAAARARDVLVLRPGNPGDFFITQRRGQRKYRLVAESAPLRLGQATRKPEALRWVAEKLVELGPLTSRKDRIAVSAVELHTRGFPMLLPHHVSVTLLMSYPDTRAAEAAEGRMREILGKSAVKWNLERISDRPPLRERKANGRILEAFRSIAREWEIPLHTESSVWPSAAGLVPEPVAVLCGLGPVGRDLHTPQESIQRISLMQRTLLLAQYLARENTV
jgi:D-alanine-D-alanine ligase